MLVLNVFVDGKVIVKTEEGFYICSSHHNKIASNNYEKSRTSDFGRRYRH